MTPRTEYLQLPQEQEGTAPSSATAPRWTPRKANAVDFAIKNGGLLLVICSQLFFASMNLCVKLLERLDPPTPILELITIRMAITVCGCIIYMVVNKIPDPILGPQGVRGLLAAGGFAVFVGLYGMFYSLNYLSVADATVISFLKPFTVALAAHFLLGEAYTATEAVTAVCSLVGVVLIARPQFLFGSSGDEDDDAYVTSLERLRAVGSALIGVCGGTASFIIMRVVRSRAHPMHVMTFFSFWCAVVGAVGMAIVHESMILPMAWEWITLLLVITLLGVGAQILVTVGLRYETATRGALGSYTQLLFAIVLELVVFGTVPSLLSAAGAAVIIAAQTYVVLSGQKPRDQPPVALNPLHPDNVEGSLFRSDSPDAPRHEEPLPEADDTHAEV